MKRCGEKKLLDIRLKLPSCFLIMWTKCRMNDIYVLGEPWFELLRDRWYCIYGKEIVASKGQSGNKPTKWTWLIIIIRYELSRYILKNNVFACKPHY